MLDKLRGKNRVVFYVFLMLFVALLSFKNFFKFDDPFIFNRVVDNLHKGNGWVYNIGERVNVATSPLHVIVLLPGKVLFSKIDTWYLAHLMDVVFLSCTAILICLIFHKLFPGQLLAQVAPLTVLISPFVFLGSGMETSLYLALAALSLLLYLHRNYPWLGVSLGLLILTRHDGIISSLILLGALWWETGRFPYKSALIMLFVVLPWFLFSWCYFGHLFPNTLYAKTTQVKVNICLPQLVAPFKYLPRGAFVMQAFIGNLDRFNIRFFYLLYLVLVVFVLFYELKQFMHRLARGEKELPFAFIVFIAAVGYFAGYMVVDVYGYSWYFSPIIFFFLLTLHAGLCKIALKYSRFNIFFLFLVAILLGFQFISKGVYRDFFDPKYIDPKVVNYERFGRFINEHGLRKTDRVQTGEIGIVGYYAKRYVIDMLGLASATIVKNQLLRRDWTWAFRKYEPEWIVSMIGECWYDWGKMNSDYHAIVTPFDFNYLLFVRHDVPLVYNTYEIKMDNKQSYHVFNGNSKDKAVFRNVLDMNIQKDVEFLGHWRKEAYSGGSYFVANRSAAQYSDIRLKFSGKSPRQNSFRMNYLNNQKGVVDIYRVESGSPWIALASIKLDGQRGIERVDFALDSGYVPGQGVYLIIDTHGLDFYIEKMVAVNASLPHITLWLDHKKAKSIFLKYYDASPGEISVYYNAQSGAPFLLKMTGSKKDCLVKIPFEGNNADAMEKLDLFFDTHGDNFYLEDVSVEYSQG